MKSIITFLLLLTSMILATEIVKPTKVVPYKKVEGKSPLELHFYEPAKKTTDSCMVFINGGGWTSGKVAQLYQQAHHFSELGVLAICVEYRTKKSHKVRPDACVEDGKSAIRWVRKHAQKLEIDPKKIVVIGASAGGHIAACTEMVEGVENEKENLTISSKPNAMILLNPVLDTTEKGYGSEKVQGFGKALSPVHLIKKRLAPSLVFHGTADTIVPFENSERFVKLMKEAGNDTELVVQKGGKHGCFNGVWFRKNSDIKVYEHTLMKMKEFMRVHGFLSAVSTSSNSSEVKKKVVACAGDSNTQRGYPKILQSQLGTDWETINCGLGGASLLPGAKRPFMKLKHFKKVKESNPDVVVIMLGTNDANPVNWEKPRKTKFKGTSGEEFIATYKQMIYEMRALPSQPQIFICTPLPIFPENSKPDKVAAREARQKNLLGEVLPLIRKIAEAENLPLIDIHTALSDSKDSCTDGLHYNKKGYTKMAEVIAETIKKHHAE